MKLIIMKKKDCSTSLDDGVGEKTGLVILAQNQNKNVTTELSLGT